MGVFEEILDSTDLDETMTRAQFLQKIEECGLNLTDLDERTRLPKDILKIISEQRANNEPFYKLNMLLKRLHLDNEINIIDSAVYMYKEFFDMKTVASCLNEENLYLLRKELTKRFNIKGNRGTSTLKLYFS